MLVVSFVSGMVASCSFSCGRWPAGRAISRTGPCVASKPLTPPGPPAGGECMNEQEETRSNALPNRGLIAHSRALEAAGTVIALAMEWYGFHGGWVRQGEPAPTSMSLVSLGSRYAMFAIEAATRQGIPRRSRVPATRLRSSASTMGEFPCSLPGDTGGCPVGVLTGEDGDQQVSRRRPHDEGDGQAFARAAPTPRPGRRGRRGWCGGGS